jgi:hypothetical protein
MRIVIDTDSKTEQQPQITKISAPTTEAVHESSTVVATSSPIDAGHARIPDAYANDTSSQMTQRPGNTSFPIAGAIDAGAPKVASEVTVASAMPDTGNMETFNQGSTFAAGPLANAVHN